MAVLCIPGFMLDDDLWRDIAPALAPFGPLIHADPRRGDTIEDMAREALALAPERFALLGFSMGGYVAREILRLAPARVTHLALIASSSRGDNEIQARRREVAAAAAPAAFRGISRRSVARSLAPERETDEALIARMVAMSQRLGGEVFHRQAAYRRAGDGAALARISCPTLVVAGTRDRLRSLAESEELAQGIPGARLVSLPTGHMIPMEAPDELGEILRGFLSGGASA